MILKSNIISFISKIRHYLIFNLGYLFFLVFAVLYFYYRREFYDAFHFYFEAPYNYFKLWFPKFYFEAYLFTIILKISFFVTLIASVYYLFRKSKQSASWIFYNIQSGYWRFIAYEFAIILPFFLLYLTLYFSLKYFVPTAQNGLQILITRGFLLHISFQAVIILFGNFEKIRNYLKNYLLLPQLPHNIAVLRIVFFFYLAYIYDRKYFSALPTVSLTSKVSLPYIGWLIELIPVNTSIYTVFIFIGIICCAFIVIGYKTRWFLLVNAVCAFYIIATPNFFGKLWHEQLVIWICWFFALSRCYDALSLDAKLSKKPIVKSADYTFPVRFIWLQLGIIYFWAGFYKLWDCGFDWALSQSMINQVQLEWLQHYDKIPAIRIDNYPILLKISGLLVIGFELCYILFVLKPATRWIAAAGGLLMHNVIGYFMYISFSHLLQAFYVVYVDFTCLFSKGKQNAEVVFGYSKAAFGTGILVLSINFLCGMFSIDTYPFSSYPKYAAIIPDTIKIIHFEPYLPDSNTVDVHAVGKKNNFRWESYGWLEYGLIKDFETGQDVQKRLYDYWEIWQSHNPELKEYKNVKVSVRERPVSPEGINQNKITQFMGTIGDCNEQE